MKKMRVRKFKIAGTASAGYPRTGYEPTNKETTVVPDRKDGTLPYIEPVVEDPHKADEQEVGQLSLDVFQTGDEIVIVAPVAGVKLDDLSINLTDEVLTIQGKRSFQFQAVKEDYFTQECFWGDFERSIILPESVDTSRVKASFKNGILTIRIPKVEKIRSRMIRIQTE